MKAGWVEKPLGDICDILDRLRKPITKSDRNAGPYPYYGATGVLDHVSGYLFDEPLVLIGEDGAKWEAGANSAFPVSGKVWVNNHAHVIRPHRNRVSDDWLIYFLNASDLMPFVSGMTVPKLNQGRLREIPIPLPPLEEQQRIVAILDEAFEGLARARAHAEANLQNARELRQKMLEDAFDGRTKGNIIRAGWEVRPLGDVCTLQRGFDLPVQDRVSGEVPLISSSGPIGLVSEVRVQGPGVATGRSGSIGTVFFCESSFWPLNTALYVKDFHGNDVRFVWYLLQNFDLSRFASGTGVPTLNRNDVHGELIAVPISVSEQRRIVAVLDDAFSNLDRLKASYQSKLQSLDALRQSLLQKAFAGELT